MICTAGTSKLLVARALAASASRAGRKVSFFLRIGRQHPAQVGGRG